MKKAFIFTIFCLCAIAVFSQLSITGNHLLLNQKNGNETVTVLVFDTITSTTTIDYTGTNIRFYKYQDINSGTYSTGLYPPDDATGYIITEDGTPKDTIWVIDYKKNKPDFKSLKAENNPSVQCQELNLILDAKVPELTYKSIVGISYSLPREFKITYNTSKWKATEWKDSIASVTVTLPTTIPITVTAPIRNTTSNTTKFTITGDQYATPEELDIKPFTFTDSDEYSGVAVKSHLTTSVTSRAKDKNNEDNAPNDKISTINFSAPIDVQFLSNANEPVAQFYKWEIFKGNELIISRSDKDHRYTFSEAGVYKVKLSVSNSNCSDKDSITITVSESAIVAPNVFTPNGDGQNDEFRVGYRSIVKFDCWVYNRWGRLVYHWNDPQKGWDGNINGKKAATGPYFYVIKAFGSDYDPKSPVNPQTKTRLGEWHLKGDINLLRDKQ